MSLSTVLAKALFDNVAESSEELGFRKGDILMVLEQDGGGPGWWVCSLHGRQGIAPANRLRLLNTASTDSASSVYLSPSSCPAPRPAPSADSAPPVYLSPRPLAEGSVYLSPSCVGVGGAPRARSSSASGPRGPRAPQTWDGGVPGGRARSPSLRGRGCDPKPQTVYQTPPPPVPHAEAVYLAPPGPPRTPAPSDDVYQTPTGGVAAVGPASETSGPATPATRKPLAQPPLANGLPLGQEGAGVYQSPSQRGGGPMTPQRDPVSPALKHPASCPRARLSPVPLRGGSPLRARTGRGGAQASPNSTRKPPPPAPPIRGVTKKDTPPCTPRGEGREGEGPAGGEPCRTEEGEGPAGGEPCRTEAGQKEGRMEEEKKKKKTKEEEEGELDDEKNQVYDTPPTSRWQQTASPTVCMDESIYNTPRALPVHTEPGSEVYDVPSLPVAVASDLQPQTYSIPASLAAGAEGEEDVYSVPSLPGDLSAPPAFQEEEHVELYSVPGPAPRADGQLFPQEGAEPDCGVYDMPAPLDPVSSTSDVQWRGSLSALIQSALSTASLTPPPPRELAASLAEILSVWKAGEEGDAPAPPLLQAWSRLSDPLPGLNACGSAPPSEAVLSLVLRALEDSAALLQIQATTSRPRLPSQDSLSRRPLPALPVAEVTPLCAGMGGRKGSWIQERPLPPPPPPTFPLPLAPPTLISTNGPGEEETGNEYAGIGLTAAPPPFSGGDSVGYVKLQGKPEPSPPPPTENAPPPVDPPTAEQRLSPSPLLPGSLSLEDSELLAFYSSQSLSHLSCLADCIQALFTSVQGNQPPRAFVSRGKTLIVTAHKLVFIGDTLSRLLTSPDLRAKVTTAGGRLCQALKAVVVATKGAAQNYPSVPATQEMVDRVAELSQHAAGFSGLLQRLAEIS